MAIASFSSTLLFFHRMCCLWLFICYWKMTADLENVITAWLLGKASFFHVHLTPSYITGLAFVWTGSFWQTQILNLTEPSCNMSRARSEHWGLCLPVPVPWTVPSTLLTDSKCTSGLTPSKMQSDFSIITPEPVGQTGLAGQWECSPSIQNEMVDVREETGLARSSLRRGSQACCAKGCSLKGKSAPDRLWINIQTFEYI